MITALVCHSSEDVIFCGKDDGAVYVYDTKSGQQIQKLFSQGNTTPVYKLWLHDEDNVISSVTSGSVMTQRLGRGQQREWIVSETLFTSSTAGSVSTTKQVLADNTMTKLLVSTSDKDTLWSLSPEQSPTVLGEVSWPSRHGFKWITHPVYDDQLILFSNNIVHIYDWLTLTRLTNEEGIRLQGELFPESDLQFMTPCFESQIIATRFNTQFARNNDTGLSFWDPTSFLLGSKSAAPLPEYSAHAKNVRSIVGDYKSRLVFLLDSGWVCTATPQNFVSGSFSHHFFLPDEWLSTNLELLLGINQKGDFIFVKGHEVAVIRNGLKSSDITFTRPPQ